MYVSFGVFVFLDCGIIEVTCLSCHAALISWVARPRPRSARDFAGPLLSGVGATQGRSHALLIRPLISPSHRFPTLYSLILPLTSSSSSSPSMAPSTNTFNLATASAQQILSLANIRAVLQRLEDTIVFQLIERAQFAQNAPMYQPGAIKELVEGEGWQASWVEWFLKEVESAHARCRRWSAPDEFPFTDLSLLPKPVLPPVKYPNLLYEHGINVNRRIYEYYRDHIVPTITAKFNAQSPISSSTGGSSSSSQTATADDGQYGSAAVRDAEVLSAFSRRIHFGMFVSESKFRSEPKAFLEPIRKADSEALLALITKPAVEAALLVRLREKARVYGQDLDQAVALMQQGRGKEGEDKDTQRKIEADEVVKIYETFVIPLTKVVEVDYLLKR